jgi:hypothetical protein
MKNLDLLAAETAQEIITKTRTHMVKEKDGKESEKSIDAGKVDNLVTKALGVLQENGVYAALLYLYSRSADEQPVAKQIRLRLLHLTSEFTLTPPTDRQMGDKVVVEDAQASAALQFLTDHICNDLDRLLLIKQLWEQTLIYARYGAKAREAEEKAREDAAKARPAEEAKTKP